MDEFPSHDGVSKVLLNEIDQLTLSRYKS